MVYTPFAKRGVTIIFLRRRNASRGGASNVNFLKAESHLGPVTGVKMIFLKAKETERETQEGVNTLLDCNAVGELH